MQSLISVKLGSGPRLALRNPDTLKTYRPLIRRSTDGCKAGGRTNSERTITELNIRHYRALPTIETDPAKRRTIATFLAEEKAKLDNLDKKGTCGGWE